jgi:hypothetical protein
VPSGLAGTPSGHRCGSAWEPDAPGCQGFPSALRGLDTPTSCLRTLRLPHGLPDKPLGWRCEEGLAAPSLPRCAYGGMAPSRSGPPPPSARHRHYVMGWAPWPGLGHRRPRHAAGTTLGWSRRRSSAKPSYNVDWSDWRVGEKAGFRKRRGGPPPLL